MYSFSYIPYFWIIYLLFKFNSMYFQLFFVIFILILETFETVLFNLQTFGDLYFFSVVYFKINFFLIRKYIFYYLSLLNILILKYCMSKFLYEFEKNCILIWWKGL